MQNAVPISPSVMGTSYKETQYNINGSAGQFLGIPCTIPCRKMSIWEVPAAGVAANPQGLQYQFLQCDNTGLGNFGPVTQQDAPGDTIDLGSDASQRQGYGDQVGFQARPDPGRLTVPATVPIALKSATVTAVIVNVREYP